MSERPTPETDALASEHRGAVIWPDFARRLERERDEALEEMAKWKDMSIEADKRFVEVLREVQAERALADRLVGTLNDLWRNGAEYEAVEGALAAWKEARND